MFKIQIPKPCHEDWNAMMPTQQGAFCAACSKEVVDFTKMTDEEVQHYFLKNATGKTCGRFRTEQVDRIRIYLPDSILLERIAGWKKYLAVVLLAFGSILFGCDVGVQTATQKRKEIDSIQLQQVPPDRMPTVGEVAPTMGKPVQIKMDTASYSGELLGTVVAPPVEDTTNALQGDISFIPDTAVRPLIDTSAYDKVFTGRILLEKKIDNTAKKPLSDTGKCNDTGYY